MSRINFIANDEEQKLCEDKCNQIISILSDIKDIKMKAYILHTLIISFKDTSGIDLTKTFRIEVDK